MANQCIADKFAQLKRDLPNGFDIGHPKFFKQFVPGINHPHTTTTEQPFEGPIQLGGAQGYYKEYTNGTIYCWDNIGAHEVHGRIKAKYDSLGGYIFPGYVYNDETNTDLPGGKYNSFLCGDIIYNPTLNEAFLLENSLLNAWYSLSHADRMALGFPISDTQTIEETNTDYSIFEGGVLFRSTSHSAQVILGKFIMVSNTSPAVANVRFYPPVPANDLDTTNFPLLTAFTLIPLATNTTLFWKLPSGLSSVAVTFNGNFPTPQPSDSFPNKRLVNTGENVFYSIDSRIHITKTVFQTVDIWIFNSAAAWGIPLAILPPMGNGGSHRDWMIPDDVSSVRIAYNGRLDAATIMRGGSSVAS